MLCCCANSDSDNESFQDRKVAPLKYKETESKIDTNGVKAQNSPEREINCVEEKPIQREVIQEKPLEREVTAEHIEREVTAEPLEREVTTDSLEIEIISDQKEGSPESQVSLAQQEVANLKQVILQELESNNSDTMSQQALLTAVDRLEAVAIKLESLACKSGNSTPAGSTDSGK